MASRSTTAEWTQLVEHLRDPVKLRIVITLLILAVGYFGIYTPLHARIDNTTRSLQSEQERHALASDVEYLRAQIEMFKARVPEKSDINEWVEYVLEGTRRFPLKLINLDSGVTKRAGPYQAVTLRVSLKGSMRDLDAFLHWAESNERLIRVDSAKLEPARGDVESRIMQITLLGLKA